MVPRSNFVPGRDTDVVIFCVDQEDVVRARRLRV